MISWFFKKKYGRPDPTAAAPAAAKIAAADAAKSVTPKVLKPARQAAQGGPEGQALLSAALGDDAALLHLAQTTTALDIKLAAVQGLTGEDALRQAERHFRSQDRKVQRLAKQRLEAAVVQRQARAQAQTLLVRTSAMLDDPLLPINHVVTLDREWQALPADVLQPEQRTQFSELRSQLDAALLARDTALQQLQRWTAQAKRCLPEWQASAVLAAEQGSPAEAELLAQAIQALREARPDTPASAALDAALDAAQQNAVQIQTRLSWLDTLPALATEPAEWARVAQSWQALPAAADAKAAQALNQRFESALLAHQPAALPEPPAAAKPARRARAEPASAEQTQQLDTLLQEAEQAQADGQLGSMQQHLQAIDNALEALHGFTLPAPWRARHQALRAEQAELKGWQQWGGARARDDLAAEAERLALEVRPALIAALPPADTVTDTAVEASTETAAIAETPNANPNPNPNPQPRLKLNLKTHAEQIQTLRSRWRELDRLGSPANQALWSRFDGALHIAYEPIAAQQAAQKAARQDNLLAREALLAGLESLPAPDPATATADSPASNVAVDWRELTLGLQRFQVAWRQLGPVEHTVPSAARAALLQRLQNTMARIETPLFAARQSAAAQREELIARAVALLPQAGAAAASPMAAADAPRLVRELQGLWQEQARQLALPRGLENALWTRFKTATDAVFVQRDANFAARDSELAQNLQQREELLSRLTDLQASTPVAQIERTLAEVDRAWRQPTELPRGAGPALEVRLRQAHASALGLLRNATQQQWWARCDSLAARLALCEERETLSDPTRPDAQADAADLNQRWSAAAELPAPWAQALGLRWANKPQAGPLPEAAVNDLLLQLETALEVPAAPGDLQDRRLLKLRALKDTLEGRSNAPQGPKLPADWLLASLRQAGLSAPQRSRLSAVLAALRAAPPGALGLPTAVL